MCTFPGLQVSSSISEMDTMCSLRTSVPVLGLSQEGGRGVLCRGRLGKGTPRSPLLKSGGVSAAMPHGREPGSAGLGWVFSSPHGPVSSCSLFMHPAIAPRPNSPNAPELSVIGPPSNPDKGHLSVAQTWPHREMWTVCCPAAKAATVTSAISKTESPWNDH